MNVIYFLLVLELVLQESKLSSMYLSILAEDKAEPHITALLLESSVISLCFPVVRGIHVESLGFQVQRCLFNFFKSYLFLSGGAESSLLAQLFSSCSARASH